MRLLESAEASPFHIGWFRTWAEWLLNRLVGFLKHCLGRRSIRRALRWLAHCSHRSSILCAIRWLSHCLIRRWIRWVIRMPPRSSVRAIYTLRHIPSYRFGIFNHSTILTPYRFYRFVVLTILTLLPVISIVQSINDSTTRESTNRPIYHSVYQSINRYIDE